MRKAGIHYLFLYFYCMEAVRTLADIMQQYRLKLAGHYPADEIRNMFCLVCEHLLNYSKIDIHLKSQEPISVKNAQHFDQFLLRLLNGEPVQYITGTVDFYGLTLQVDKRVLIPRPETEELVEWILRDDHGKSPSCIDLGTGSGCIAVALAKNLPGATVTACDISEDALTVARINAEKNHTAVEFFRHDILNGQAMLPGKYQVMVSNPPYVRELEKVFMRNNVLDYEPGIALFVPDHDPLVYYRNIALLGRKFLMDGGTLYLEINENFSRESLKLMQNAGFYGVEIRKDINGKMRMVKGRK